MTQENLKVALVTGAGRGIGRATAIELSRRGYALALVSRTESQLRETAGLCETQTLPLVADVADPSACGEVMRRTLEQFDRLDVLVNNAGSAPSIDIEATTADRLRAVMDANVTSAWELSRLAWPIFKQQDGGAIVNLSSVSAVTPFAGLAAYAAAKSAINGMTLALAREGAAHNIRVLAVGPAATETTMFRSLPGVDAVPVTATLRPEEVASVIADAATGALRYASGEVIYLRKQVMG